MSSFEQKFDPSDPKYKKVGDLPEKEQEKYREVEGGFVMGTAKDLENISDEEIAEEREGQGGERERLNVIARLESLPTLWSTHFDARTKKLFDLMLADFPSFSEDTLKSPEVREAVTEKISDLLYYGDDENSIMKIREVFLVSREEFGSILTDVLKQKLSSKGIDGGFDEACQMIISYASSEGIDVYQLPGVRDALCAGICDELRSGREDAVLAYDRVYPEGTEVRTSPEIQSAAKSTVIRILRDYGSDGHRKIERATKVIKFFSLPQEMIVEATRHGIAHAFAIGGPHFPPIMEMKNAFAISQELIEDAAVAGLAEAVSGCDINVAENIQESFQFSRDILLESVKNGLAMYYNKIGRFREDRVVVVEEVNRIIEAFAVPSDVLESPDVRQSIKYSLMTAAQYEDVHDEKDESEGVSDTDIKEFENKFKITWDDDTE